MLMLAGFSVQASMAAKHTQDNLTELDETLIRH